MCWDIPEPQEENKRDSECNICDEFGMIPDPQHGHVFYCNCGKRERWEQYMKKVLAKSTRGPNPPKFRN